MSKAGGETITQALYGMDPEDFKKHEVTEPYSRRMSKDLAGSFKMAKHVLQEIVPLFKALEGLPLS